MIGRPRSSARAEALRRGEKKYQGARCVHGHLGIRRTNNCHCVECEYAALSRKKQVLGTREGLELICYPTIIEGASRLAVVIRDTKRWTVDLTVADNVEEARAWFEMWKREGRR